MCVIEPHPAAVLGERNRVDEGKVKECLPLLSSVTKAGRSLHGERSSALIVSFPDPQYGV